MQNKQSLPLLSSLTIIAVIGLAGCGDNGIVVPGPDDIIAPAPLAVSAGAAQALCVGQSQALSASVLGGVEPYAYHWTADPACNGCINDPSAPNPTVNPAVNTVFHLTVTDAVGQLFTTSVPVDVRPLPVVSGTEQTIDPGTRLTLGSATGSNESSSWTCNRPDCALADATAAQPSASPTRSTRYALTRTNADGCSASAESTVWVNLQAVRTLPEDGEMSWPVSAKLLVEFDLPLDPATLTSDVVYIEDSDSGLRLPVTTALGGDGRLLYVTPGTGYVSGVDYVLTVAAGVMSDDPVLPNKLAQDLVISFTSDEADRTPPAITYRLPGIDAVNVPRNTAVVAAFNETLDPGTVTSQSFHLDGAAGALPGSLVWNPASRTVTFKAGAHLDPNEKYKVFVDGVADMSGNALRTHWSFTTGTELDTTPPEVVAVSPADGSMGVSANSSVVVTFSELVDAAVMSGLVVTQSGTGQVVAGTLSFDTARFEATWTPVDLLGSLTHYTVTVSGFVDMAGNAMTAPFVSTFTTRQVLFSDDFNSGDTSKWTLTGDWGASSRRYHSPGFSLADSPVFKYAPNSYGTAQLAAPIDVGGMSSVSIQYWFRGQSERKADFFAAHYRLGTGSNAGPWVEVRRTAGNAAWFLDGFVVEPNGAHWLDVKFTFESNESRERDGVYVDDFVIQTP
jgi:hypothetical protein